MIEPGPGILLISDPFLKDPNFMRTVVVLCEHQNDGSFGFVINRKYENTLDELMPELEGLKIPVYYGGPVQMDTIHFIHQYPDEIPGSREIIRGVFWGGDFELLIGMLKSKSINLDKIRFFIGYSGWGSGQLNEELSEKSWLTVKAARKLIFHKKHDQIWKEAIKTLGGDYEQMIHYPIDPQLN